MLARQNTTQLTRLSDHVPDQTFIYGLGTTTDPIIEACQGDIVKVLSAEVALACGVVGFCGVMSGPAAIVTVPLSILASCGIILNAAIVCSQYDALQYQDALPKYGNTPPPGECCRSCKWAEWGTCTKWGDAVAADEWCEDWNNTIDVPVILEPLAPIAAPPIEPVKPPVTATHAQATTMVGEEINLARLFAVREPELSPQAQDLHINLQSVLNSAPSGFTCDLAESVNASGLAEDEVLCYFEELSAKRPKHYSVLSNPIALRVFGVA